MPERPGLDLPDVLWKVDAAVLAHDPETGEILGANGRAEELYRRPVEELVGLRVGALTSDDAAYSNSRARERIEAAARGEPQVFEWLNRHEDGQRYWVRVNLERATIDGRAVVLATVRDVSTYKAREERMKLLYRVLRHNLRNDMNVVAGNAEVVADAVERTDLDVSVRENVEEIRETAVSVSRLSDRVGELERAAHEGTQERRVRDLSAVVDAAVDRVRQRHDDADVDVEVVEDCRVNVDDVFVCGLEQLVDNAVEHGTPATGAGDAEGVEVRARPGADGETVNVVVSDRGPGIPCVETAVLETDVERSTVRHGSGLGLWVAKWAVDSHDGTLVFTETDPGTTVHVRAPVTLDR